MGKKTTGGNGVGCTSIIIKNGAVFNGEMWGVLA